MNFPHPEAVRKCPRGCGLLTVVARLGDGRTTRVHCGTWRSTCPGQTAQPPTPVFGGPQPMALAA